MIGAREYGTSGPLVVVLHGGPGAPGSAAPLARGLADTFRVLEPLQRASGERPLTVARHVADLRELLSRRGGRPALVGHSWGAMLALVYAAAYPSDVAALALVGCGTFDRKARDRLIATREERMDDALRRDLARLAEEIPDPDAMLQATANLLLPVDSYEPLATELELDACDARAHHETWEDMVRLQNEGVYPAAFAVIDVPVLMLHGADDPHPGPLIRASLAPHIPRLEYRELERCGHYPWLEKAARDEFFSALRRWLGRHLGVGG